MITALIPIKRNSQRIPNKNFLEIGNISKNPKMSVANPGMIKRTAANAIAAPETIS